MSTNITSYPLGGVLFQGGNGYPTHISTRGSLYVDLDTAITYINKDGLINWQQYYDGDALDSNFLPLSGGTVFGPTSFTGGLTGNSIYSPFISASTIIGQSISGNSVSATTYYNLPEQLLINDSSTGLIAFDGLSFTASATTFNVGAIKAWFIDNTTTPATPSKYYVEFSATSGNTLVNLTGQNVTYIAINSGGTISQQSTPFTPTQLRTMIRLGVIVHSNRIFINAVNNQPLVMLSPSNQLSDFLDSLGTINISGNTFSANGANLSLNKSAGQIFKHGINFVTNNKDPHTLMLPALTAPSTMRYRFQNSLESSDTSFIDPNTYDVSGVSTTVPDTKYTVQRIYLFQSNLVRIQYGQKIYDSLDDANSGIIKDSFNVEQNLVENGLLRGILIIKKGTTDLTDTSRVRFLDVSKFGTLLDTNLGSGLFRGETLNNSSTGLINGGAITFASSSSVNVAAGSGRIVNNTTNPDAPTLTQVNWSATTGLTITNLTGQSGTVLFVTTAGTITQQNITTFTNSSDFRDKIYIGGVGHPTGTITAIFNNPMAIINPTSQINDLNQSIGPFSINGNKLSKLTGTLKLFKSAGKSYFSNANYQTDNTNPSIFNVTTFSAGSLSYVTQTSFLGFVSSDINTTQWDNGGVLTVMGNNNFVAHRIWHQPSNNLIFFQYGQAEYATLSEARSKFTSENFITPLPLEFGAYLIGVILVRKGETNLDDPTRSEIIPQGKFAGSGAGSGGSVDTLQSAYENSVSPEIRTDATRGAVTIRNSAGTDTLNIIEGQSSGGTTTFTLKGDGSIQSNTLTGSTTRMVVASSGGTLGTQAISDTYTTGGTFSGSVLTLVNNSGGTFSVTGFTSGGTGGDCGTLREKDTLITTNDTQTLIGNISGFTNGTYIVESYITAAKSTTEYGVWKRTLGVTTTGSTPIIVYESSDLDNTSIGFPPDAIVYSGITGNTINIYVKGISANTFSWVSYFEIIDEGVATSCDVVETFATSHNGIATIDFGFDSGLEGDFASIPILNSNILTTSQVLINVLPSGDHAEGEDALLDGLTFKISDIVANVGFNINCYANNGTWGEYNLSYKIIN